MGAHGGRVPYLKKVNSEAVAAITNGVCFCFGDNCNVFYNNGKQIGAIDYVGAPGPGMKFKVRGRANSAPSDFEDKYVELLQGLGIAVPLME